MNLSNKTVLITGASGGLGTEVTGAFLAAGASVVGVARSIKMEGPLPNFTPMAADISTLDKARALAAQVELQHGGIDVLVHLVGGFAGGKLIHETDPTTIDQMFGLNAVCLFHRPGIIRAMGAFH